jgi:hypothetical protein
MKRMHEEQAMASISTRTSTAVWPPDDTEESIVGVDRHQLDIISLRTGINEEAYRQAAGGPLPWQAITQIMLLGCRRWDGSPYTVIPDMMVFPRPMRVDRGSYSLSEDGPPVLIVEVASASTFPSDLSLERGKAWTYAQAGIHEYLVLDPTGVFVPEIGRGWRLRHGTYQPWVPDDAGRWRSEMISVSLGMEGGLAAVYGVDGHRKWREGEMDAAVQAGHTQGRAEGRAEGQVEGTRSAVRHVARQRYGVVAALEDRIDAASATELATLLDRLLTGSGLDDL